MTSETRRPRVGITHTPGMTAMEEIDIPASEPLVKLSAQIGTTV